MMKRYVIATMQVEGVHVWPACEMEEVNYLANLHRHMFHIKAVKEVSHNDRDVEIISLKHAILSYLTKYRAATYHAHNFGTMSCEDIAEELCKAFSLASCEVLEDGENGAVIVNDESLGGAL